MGAVPRHVGLRQRVEGSKSISRSFFRVDALRGSGFQDVLLADPCDGSSRSDGSLPAFFGRGLPLPIAMSTFYALRV